MSWVSPVTVVTSLSNRTRKKGDEAKLLPVTEISLRARFDISPGEAGPVSAGSHGALELVRRTPPATVAESRAGLVPETSGTAPAVSLDIV